MGDLTVNQIFGSLLVVLLMLFGLGALSDTVFADTGGDIPKPDSMRAATMGTVGPLKQQDPAMYRLR